jgi:hypothetical protein
VVGCPVCTKVQLVYVQGPTRTSCYYCGARWVQSGEEQEGVIGLGSTQSAMRFTSQVHSTAEETR